MAAPSPDLTNNTLEPSALAQQQSVSKRVGPPRSKYQAPPQIMLQVGENVPYHKCYKDNCQSYQFFELSCKGGHQYKMGKDCDGIDIFHKHSNESNDSVKDRRAHSPIFSFCKPIVRKFNDYVYTSTIKRDVDNAAFKKWCDDVDLYGTSFHEYMRQSAEKAQKLGTYFVIIDSTKSEQYLSVAQVEQNGDQMFLVGVHPDRVINWCQYSNQFAELLVIFPEEQVVRYYTRTTVQTASYEVGKKGDKIITVVGDPIEHGYPYMPVVKFNCDDDDQPQILDIADCQKTIFNTASTLMEEHRKQTFTSFALLGTDIGEINRSNNIDPEKPAFFYKDIGARKVTCIASKDAKVERFSGDANNAESLRATIMMLIKEIFRHAGLNSSDVEQKSGNVESAKAMVLKANDVGTIARSLSDHFESAENRLIQLWSVAMKQTVADSSYEDDFNDESLATELTNVIQLVASEVPALLKTVAVRSLAPKICHLEEGEEEQILAQAKELYSKPAPVVAPPAPSALPPPPPPAA